MVSSKFNRKFFAAVFAAYVFLFSPTTYAADDAPAYVRSATDDDGMPAYIRGNSYENNPPAYVTNKPQVEPPQVETSPVETPLVDTPPIVETPNLEAPPPEGAGLEFLMYNQNGVMAFAIIAAHEYYKVCPVIARNQIQGRATLSGITSNYNDIAMINASYFERDGSIIGMLQIDDTIVSRDDYTRSAIGIKQDGTIVFGQVGYHGVFDIEGKEFPICGVNCDRPKDSIVLYTNQFGASTNTNDSGVELIVRNGVISSVMRGKGNNRIPSDGYIISAQGNAWELFKGVNVGDDIIIDQEVLVKDENFYDAIHIVGAGPRLVKNGQIYVTADEEAFPDDIRVGRAPRSAFGVTKYGDYIFAVVDGRQAHSQGCTLQEWADILINQFGAVDAINLDGGGSAELIVNDNIVNSPSDGQERPVASALMILSKWDR
ncbi:MAG: phosphodiester glycosidase family protein [Selenomonadaceae bacterium]|nr:phosphodiester glycosidase family protein [Selenomonadaceae bacterium]